MKKSIFLFFAAILYSVSAWGAETFNDGQYIYYQMEGNSNWTSATYVPMFGWYWDSGNFNEKVLGKEVPGTSKKYYYEIVPNQWTGYLQIMRMNGSNTGEEWNYSTKKAASSDKTKNCFYFTSASWNDGTLSIKTYAPPMSSVTLADNETTVNSGTGTQADPYIIEIGTKIKVQASGTKAVDDPDAVINYAFKYGATSQDSETTTWEIDANSPSTTYAIELEGYTKVNTTSSEKKAATKLYYQTVADATLPTYQVTVTANDPAMGTVTGAGEYSEGATAELTATPNDGYKFVNWTVGSTEKSTNPTYSFTVTENVTLVANFQAIPEETVYFINTNEWTGTINAYAWTDGTPKVENAGWAGLAATKEDFQIGGYDVYSYTAKQGLYANVIFNGTGGQTTDLTWSDGVGKYYAPSKSKWYDTKEAAAEALAAPVEYDYVYFINTNSWAAVNIYTWNSEIATWPGVAMNKEAEQIAGFDVYSYKVVKGTSFGGMKFNEGQDKAQTGDLTWQAGKYYAPSTSEWYADAATAEAALAAVVTYDYYITGSFNGNNPKKAENGMTLDGTVYKATVTLAAGDNTLKVTDGTWEKTWGANELGAAYEEVSNPNDYNNIKITLAAEKEITVIFDATAGKITFEGLTPYVAPLTYTVTVPAGTEKCYIAGNMNGWAFQEMEAVTGETNKFTITIVGAKETDEYKYACQADWAYAEVIDGGGNRTNWSELDEVTTWGKPVVYTYYLMGVNGDWTTGIEMEVNTGAENEVMLTCQPVNGEVKIKRLGDDESEYWYGGKSLKEDEGNLGTNTEAATDGDGNIALEEGIYNFYFNTADGKLWIAAATGCVTEPTPEVIRTGLTAGNYYTICMTKEMKEVKGATLWSFCGKDANFAYLVQEDAPYTAGKAYIMYAEAETVSAILTGEPAAAPVANGAIYGTFADMDQDALTAAGDNIYLVIDNQLRRVDGQTGNSLPANRAYVDIDDITGGAPAGIPANRVRSMPMQPQVATGMENVDASAQPVKTIINGQLFILRGEKMYDAQGKLVK